MRMASAIGGSAGALETTAAASSGTSSLRRRPVPHPGGGTGQAAQRQERQRRQAGHERQHCGRARRHRHRLRVAAELAHQRHVGGSLGAALGDDDAGCGRDQQGRDLRDQAVADGQGGERRGGIAERHAVPAEPDGQAADDVDDGDEQGGDRVAAHELRGTVHGAVEAAFLLQLAPAHARNLVGDGAGRQLGVDRHLLAGHGVQAEPRRDLGDAPGALGDDHEVHHQQDGEQDQADHHVAAHQEAAERGHDVAGGEWPLVAVAQDQPRGRDLERQPEQRGQQQQGREAGEVERALEEQRHHQHQHRGGHGQGQAEIEHHRRQGQDQHRQQSHDRQRQPDIGARV